MVDDGGKTSDANSWELLKGDMEIKKMIELTSQDTKMKSTTWGNHHI